MRKYIGQVPPFIDSLQVHNDLPISQSLIAETVDCFQTLK